MEDLIRTVKENVKEGYEFEIFFQRVKKLKVETSQETLETLSTSEEMGVGLRVLKDKRVGFSYVSNPDRDSIKDALKRAQEMCDLQEPDEGNLFNCDLRTSDVESPYDREGLERDIEAKIEIPLSMEKKAKELDPRVKGVRKSSYTEGEFEVALYNSCGLEFAYKGSFFSAMISTLAQEGQDSAIAWEYRASRYLRDLDVDALVKDAVFKSTSLLNPQEFKTKTTNVLFFRESFAMLLEAFVPMFLGDSLVKGKTLLAGKKGEEVASELLTLIDDGTLDRGFATGPYDAEGVPKRRKFLIKNGRFEGFLHNLYSAKLSEEESTGNAERSSYKSVPSCGITNLYVERGGLSFEELIAMEDEVFLVLELMGLHTADPISGEFSLGASGVLFKNGKPKHAVRGVTVAGNILDLWHKIVGVGEDLEFYGNVGSPSVLVKDITVGGS